MDELFEVLLKDYEPFQKRLQRIEQRLKKAFKKVKRFLKKHGTRYVNRKIKRIRPTIKNFVWRRF